MPTRTSLRRRSPRTSKPGTTSSDRFLRPASGPLEMWPTSCPRSSRRDTGIHPHRWSEHPIGTVRRRDQRVPTRPPTGRPPPRVCVRSGKMLGDGVEQATAGHTLRRDADVDRALVQPTRRQVVACVVMRAPHGWPDGSTAVRESGEIVAQPSKPAYRVTHRRPGRVDHSCIQLISIPGIRVRPISNRTFG